MTVLTTRPDATATAGSTTIGGGAATRHAALNDNSDSTYISGGIFATPSDIGFVEPTIPTGGTVKRVTLRARVAKVGTGQSSLYWAIKDGTTTLKDVGSSGQNVSNTSITTITLGYVDRTTPVTALVASIATLNAYVYELYFDTTYVAKPVVTPYLPTGTLTNANVPTVVWTDTLDSDGGDQGFYIAKIFSSAQYGAGGFDPATSTPTATNASFSADRTVTFSDPLPNGTYRAYVAIAQSGSALSDYAYTQFTISVTPPNAPSIAVTPQASSARQQVVVTPSGSGSSADRFQVQRSPDGTNWTTFYDSDASGTQTVYDYRSPNGVNYYYQARVGHYVSGSLIYSAWATSSASQWSSPDWWLRDPADPTLNYIFKPKSQPTLNRVTRQNPMQILGSSHPVVVSDTTMAPSGDLVIRCDDNAARASLVAILANNRPIEIVGSAQAVYWDDRHVIFGDLSGERVVDSETFAMTFESLTWQEVAAP